jgi:GntR family transcriptional regulator/MocR family aminotransferase
MSLPIPLSRSGNLSLQEQIYRFIRDKILSGGYRSGIQLPSSRDLAEGLQVARNTVTLAYEWLTSEGYIETRRGAGTFVCKVVPDIVDPPQQRSRSAAQEPPRPAIAIPFDTSVMVNKNTARPQFDFWYGRPDARQFPLKTWRRLITEQLTQATRSLAEYGEQAGEIGLRQAISEHLSTSRGFTADPSRIIITFGAQEALNIVCRLLVNDRTVVALENPGYASIVALVRSVGAMIAPVAVDEEGIIPEALHETRATLVYTTPSHQFPTGAVLPLERRQAVLAWAEKVNGYVIEDDYDSEIIYDRPPSAALAALDSNRHVIYVGSFSKSLGAGIRLGFLVLPSELVEAAVAHKSLSTFGQPWLEQAALAAFIREGHFRSHLRRIRTLYRARRDAVIESLRRYFGDELAISGHSSGLHLIWTLPEHLPDAKEVSAIARAVDVGFYTPWRVGAVEFGRIDGSERRLLIGYACLTPAEIQTGVKRVAGAIADHMRRR